MRGFMRFIRSGRLLTVAAFSLAAADVRDDIRRLGRDIDGVGRSGEK